MAYLAIVRQDTLLVRSSQDCCLELRDTWANQKVLFVLLRALRSSETGKPLFTSQQLAEAFGYTHRQNIQNFLQEFEHRAGDVEAYLRRRRKGDAPVGEAVVEAVRQTPLATEAELCARGSARLGRSDLTPANIHAALEQGSCSVIRTPLRQQRAHGAFHPKEAIVLEEALTALMESLSRKGVRLAEQLQALGGSPSERTEETVGQRQHPEAVAQ